MTVIHSDALAQVFVSDKTMICSKIGLFFKSVPSSNTGVKVQIRDVVNGYPGSTIYVEEFLLKSQIVVGEAETGVKLSKPFVCMEGVPYALCILLGDIGYSLHYSTVGEEDSSGEIVKTQSDRIGVLFTSTNGTAWEAHQKSDLAFKVYKCNFIPSASVELPEITRDMYQFAVRAEWLDKSNGGVRIFSQHGNQSEWNEISTDVEYHLGSSMPTHRFKLNISSRDNLSPIISSNKVSLLALNNYDEGWHITKGVHLDESCTKVRLILRDVYTPAGASIDTRMRLSTSDNTFTSYPETSRVITPRGGNRFDYDISYTVSATKFVQLAVLLQSSDRMFPPTIGGLMLILTQ